jgi:hypothetical protein
MLPLLLLLLFCVLQCPYSTVIPTMKGGIEMSMMFGDLFKDVAAAKGIDVGGSDAHSKKRGAGSAKRRRPAKAAKRRTQV